jgi:hypothetical protein
MAGLFATERKAHRIYVINLLSAQVSVQSLCFRNSTLSLLVIILRIFIGYNARNAPGTTGGQANVTPMITVQDHTLTIAEIPTHNHGGTTGIENTGEIYYDMHGGSNSTQAVLGNGRWINSKRLNRLDQFQHTHIISSEGGSRGHSHIATSSEINLHPPFYALLYIMKL